MTERITRKTLEKIRKLARIPVEIREAPFKHCEITRLTSMKTLCETPEMANRFALYLTERTVQRVEQKQERSQKESDHLDMMRQALSKMAEWIEMAKEEYRKPLRDLLFQLVNEQNEHRRVKSNVVRMITDSDLLVVEYALRCFVRPDESGYWAYQTARHYAERYNPSYGTGLIPESIPLVEDIVEFWRGIYDLNDADLFPSSHKKQSSTKRSTFANPTPPAQEPPAETTTPKNSFTYRQGQFLAFIHLYTKLHRRAPAERDMQYFFGVTPPSVHSMVNKLAELGLITKEPGKARSIHVNIAVEDVPELDEIEGPAW
ncbi:MAG: LexA family protein [Gemmataceae bacterium]